MFKKKNNNKTIGIYKFLYFLLTHTHSHKYNTHTHSHTLTYTHIRKQQNKINPTDNVNRKHSTLAR